jgi:hypothetical protein
VPELLRNELDPLADLVNRRQGARAGRYQLRIPDAYADSVRWRRRRAGRVDAVHPAFLVPGGTAGLVYQVLDGNLAAWPRRPRPPGPGPAVRAAAAAC